MTPVTRSDIETAAGRILRFVRRTPVIDLGDALDGGYRLILKLEHLQVTGSFKPRGAVSVLTETDLPEAGVAAASGGNFGAAVAYAAKRLGVPATIFVPDTSPRAKIDRIAIHGADVEVVSGFYDQALDRCLEFVDGSGAFMAHAYDQHGVVAGQGTIGMELSEQVPDLDAVLVAVGGGGLIAGVASWLQRDAEVVAVESEGCPSFHRAREAGRPVEAPVGGLAASSLGARMIGEQPWVAEQFVDVSVLTSDDSLVQAQRWVWAETRQMIEPAAAATVAVLLDGGYRPHPGSTVVALLSGANLDPSTVQ